MAAIPQVQLANGVTFANDRPFVLIGGMTPATWVRLGVWLAIGLVVYFAYSRHHSRLMNK